MDNGKEQLVKEIMQNRDFMKCPDFSKGMLESDQQLKLPQPPVDKAAVGEIIQLPAFDDVITCGAYADLLDIRRSVRNFSDKAATQAQLAFMLWSVQGVQGFMGETRYASKRPVPSGGARHPFEAYIAAFNVDGLKPGLYHYLPLENIGEKSVSIEFLKEIENAGDTVVESLAGQKWAANASFVVYFTCIAYRAEWRYSKMAHRVALIDLGHVGQNAMLSAAAMGLGSCCCAAYNTEACDKLLGVDGKDEFTVYAIPVGTPIKA